MDKIKFLSKVDKDGRPVYSHIPMQHMETWFKNGLTIEEVDSLLIRDASGNHKLAYVQMSEITIGFNIGLTKEQVMFYAKFDKDNSPVYNSTWMETIRIGFDSGVSLDRMEVFAKLNKDERPMFNPLKMQLIMDFFIKANEKQFLQMKEAIDSGLTFPEFSLLANENIPAENIRVYRSLYELGCDKHDVEHVLKYNFDYEHLKQIKYLLSCAKKIEEFSQGIANHDIYGFKPIYIISNGPDLNDLNLKRENLALDICFVYDLKSEVAHGMSVIAINAIKKCLEHNMDPEKIHFLVSSGYDDEEIRAVSEYLLSGADFSKVKKLRKEAKNIFKDEEMSKILETCKDDNSEIQL